MPTKIQQQLSKQNIISKINIHNLESVTKFINSVSIRNVNTAKQYSSRLMIFQKFVYKKYGINIDQLIQQLKNKKFILISIKNNDSL
jgi:hypothetical protein